MQMRRYLESMQRIIWLVCVCLALTVLCLVAFMEVLIAYPVPGWIYLSLAIVLSVMVVIRPDKPRCFRLSAIMIVALWIGITILYFADWTSRKPFLRDLSKVRTGMTEKEVRDAMSGYMEGSGLPANPFDRADTSQTLHIAGSGAEYSISPTPSGDLALSDTIIFRHSNSGDFDSDWGMVRFRNGKVVDVRFSPD